MEDMEAIATYLIDLIADGIDETVRAHHHAEVDLDPVEVSDDSVSFAVRWDTDGERKLYRVTVQDA